MYEGVQSVNDLPPDNPWAQRIRVSLPSTGDLMTKTPHADCPPDSAKAIIYALAANVAIALAKFAGAMFTGSGHQRHHNRRDVG